MIQVKPGVEFSVLRSEIYSLFSGLELLFKQHKAECVITCGTERHPEDDPHPHGFAIDLRSHDVPSDLQRPLFAELSAFCGQRYTVLFEGEGSGNAHYHVQLRKDLWREIVAQEKADASHNS